MERNLKLCPRKLESRLRGSFVIASVPPFSSFVSLLLFASIHLKQIPVTILRLFCWFIQLARFFLDLLFFPFLNSFYAMSRLLFLSRKEWLALVFLRQREFPWITMRPLIKPYWVPWIPSEWTHQTVNLFYYFSD